MVATLWFVANAAQVIDNDREVPSYVNFMFAAVVGWLFGTWIGKKRNGGDDDAP